MYLILHGEDIDQKQDMQEEGFLTEVQFSDGLQKKLLDMVSKNMLNIQQIRRKRISKNIKKQMLGDKESKVVIKKEIKKDGNPGNKTFNMEIVNCNLTRENYFYITVINLKGVSMIKELIKIKENNSIVSIFCNEDDTSMFLEGYIYAIGRQDFLIKHITPHGLADGYILKKIDSVMHLEISGQYEKKIEKLYSKKNQRHIDLKLQDKIDLKDNIFQICMNNKYIVSIEMIQDDECPIKGVVNKIDDSKIVVSKLTEYGESDGEAILKKENIDTISFLGVDEEDIQLLRRK